MRFSNSPDVTFWIFLGVSSGICLWWEMRKSRRRKTLRLSLLILAMVSLAALYLKPTYQKKAPNKSFLIKTGDAPAIFSDPYKQDGFSVYEGLESYLKVAESFNVDSVLVVGKGLNQWDLERLQGPFGFIPDTAVVEGFLDFNLTPLVLGKSGELELEYHFMDDTDLWLSGTGFGQFEKRSLTGSGEILISVQPLVAGNLTVQLHAVRNEDTIASEIVPVFVSEEIDENALLLSGAPSFELNFLKRFLIDQGYGVAERHQVSKGQFRRTFSRMTPKDLRSIKPTLLRHFTVVILDDIAYSDLNASEQRQLTNEVKRGSLSLVWLGPEPPPFANAVATRSEPVSFSGTKVNLEAVNWDMVSEQQITCFDQHVGWVLNKGIGSIVVPRLRNSYKLVLSGEGKRYQALWNELFDQVQTLISIQSKLELSGLARRQQPTMIRLKMDQSDVEVKVEDIRVPIEQEWYLRNAYQFKCWPAKAGWNNVFVNEEIAGRFYAFDKSQWALKEKRELADLNAFESELRAGEQRPIRFIETEISPWIFFVLFLLSMGGLWLEQRIS